MDELGRTVQEWLVVLAATVFLNVVPGFMPPTWSLLTFFHLRQELAIVPLAAIGAVGAVIGRWLLAVGSRLFGSRVLSPARQVHLQALGESLKRRRGLSMSGLALFAIGPIPSNYLFIAVGLARMPLTPVLAVFGAARFVSYLLWITAADTAATSLQEVMSPRFGRGAAVVAQIGGFLVLVLIARLDWARLLPRWLPGPVTGVAVDPPPTADSVSPQGGAS